MYSANCPSCGAQVNFRSAASVMAVCEYCRSTLVKEAGAVRDIGKMADCLEDYSPLRIGVSGNFDKRRFTLVGRIQLRYEAGFWNEWYVLFDDGTPGWLSDASGQYVFTLPAGRVENAPPFTQLQPGLRYTRENVIWHAADVRSARCTGGSGELPFAVGAGWEAKVADFRAGERFLTLDYSDSAVPDLYIGRAVELDQLQCQLLRGDDEIAETAGRYRGKTQSLECPNCGGSLNYQVGQAVNLMCPSCHAEVDASEDRAVVLAKHDEIETLATTLSLGDNGNISGTAWKVIGLMKCRETDSDETSEWVEYLLFNARLGFGWLVESSEGWERVAVMNAWPDVPSEQAVQLGGKTYTQLYRYGSQVIYAAGAFNWRVSLGDRVMITDFRGPDGKISAERSANEITWSLARPVPAQQIAQWFGKKALVDAPLARPQADSGSLKGLAWVFTILLLFLNVPLAMFAESDGLVIIVFALLFLWLPVLVLSRLDGRRG
ncbi:MAG: DUF4178 domain-containing protein [Rhodocyclaceae bacterium]|nr:DUF4178 domain-containing protein [Rhodocyclaceae bacterium]